MDRSASSRVAGISVQNGVIMVEQIEALRRKDTPLGAVVAQGAAQRLRPILMTALMAGFGLLPAALSHGIVSATLIALNLLPLLFPPIVGERE